PALQFVGIGTVEVTLDGVVYPALAGSRTTSLIPLRRMLAEARPHQMVTGVGDACGLWVITDISDTRTFFTDNGEARKLEFSLSLKFYGSDSERASAGGIRSGSSASPVVRVDFVNSGVNSRNNTEIDIFDDLFALADDISNEFSIPQTRTAARLAGDVARATAASAQVAVDALSVLGGQYRRLPQLPQGAFGASGRLHSAVQTLADLSGAADGTLTALVSLAQATESEEDMLPIVVALASGIRHVRDAASLTRYGVDSDVQLLERTAEIFLAVASISGGCTETERRTVAETCRSAAEHGRTLMRSCEATCRCAEILLDKLSEVHRP
ncbi:MAG: phage tail protein, partial [Bilophila sp.]